MLQMENDNSSLRTTDAMPDLTEIVGTLSHELRTPLATIKGYTATLLRSAQRLSLEEQQEFLQTIAQATEHLEIVTTRMIDLARLEAGNFPLEVGTVDMLTLVQEAIAVARQWVPAPLQEQMTFHLYPKDRQGHLTRTAPLVRGDASRLRDVLLALLENAIRFSPHGGKIEVVVRPVQAPEGTTPSFLEICLCDYGVGIPPEHLEPIFHPYHRVDTRLTREVNGVGLGLALCSRLIALHGGRIWAESCQAGGSAFHLWLPLVESAECGS
jgi:signal transduction histidine kinase